jgi:hypothetical protein
MPVRGEGLQYNWPAAALYFVVGTYSLLTLTEPLSLSLE